VVFAETLLSPLGPLMLLSNGREVTGLYFLEGHRRGREPNPEWASGSAVEVIRHTEEQLEAYFDGSLREFELPLRLEGTEFQRAVWRTLREIPYGVTTTYGALAARLGRRDAVRAVGSAVGRNPISVIVPCHRVVGAGGHLIGFAGGLDRKQYLLDLELRCSSSLS